MKFIKAIFNGFLKIFREPRDIHRVLIAGVMAVFVSHVVYLLFESETVLPVTSEIYIAAILILSMFAFIMSWAIFSSKLSIKLYVRQAVVIGWGVLGHRLGYGVESLGSMFFNQCFFSVGQYGFPLH